MFDIVLYQPEIPPNTGNIIRLCANTGAGLHLVHPLGFTLDDAQLRRAGLDYHEYARIHQHDSIEAARSALPNARWVAFSTRGTVRYDRFQFAAGRRPAVRAGNPWLAGGAAGVDAGGATTVFCRNSLACAV